ncbi:MAG TPA: gliding motility-associated C-terminal domain-containing protein, partial [Flavobacteriales bacterium]|nr:gliding motility-associated C-terminal domain-containing protein [Flavobacteriales bacterium]
PNAIYDTPGVYDVVLTMTTDAGCVGSTSVRITVGATDVPSMPNVISPNGDGVNDAFVPLLPCTEPFRLTLYNRWGQQLFGTSELMQGWDARANGVKVPDGTYFWTLDALHAPTTVQHLSGTVTVLGDQR